jgi:DNA excision repair protein ERCC-2
MVSDERKKSLLFPFSDIRDEQNKMLLLTDAAIQNKRNLIVHAPTGLGKTAATLAPALAAAIDKDLTVLFLTSRHTQHKIAIETLKLIKQKHGTSAGSVSIIGKKWMCLVPGVETLYSREFADYCRKVREDKKCEFYVNARKNQNKFTMVASSLLKNIEQLSPLTTEEVISHSKQEKMCPYEISLGMAKTARVIITDYYYLFHPDIGDNFLAKAGKELDKLIVIVDEAHNLPYRLKDLASEYLSSITIKRAIKEARKLGYDSTIEVLNDIQDVFNQLTDGLKLNSERLLTRKDFENALKMKHDYEQLMEDLEYLADSVREQQKQSYIGSVAKFLKVWQGTDDGFVRIISLKQGLKEPYTMLSYRCLDPSVICKDVINGTWSTILMSGTLQPTSMYRELLGLEDSQEVVFKDPFPKKNRLNLVVPLTTTKYESRNDMQYRKIADVLSDMINSIPGNSAVFFPSYYIRDQVLRYFETKTEKTVFSESSELTKAEKHNLLEKFKSYKDTGAVLVAVASGSFGEGIDLPGDLLKAVIIVGLPLTQPDLETKSLIEYFDRKFRKGWDYGYLFPAFNKSLQNAGRCIRSETDRGLIVFLDERYSWTNYRRCFPEDWHMEVSKDYKRRINEFFQG